MLTLVGSGNLIKFGSIEARQPRLKDVLYQPIAFQKFSTQPTGIKQRLFFNTQSFVPPQGHVVFSIHLTLYATGLRKYLYNVISDLVGNFFSH